jgi:hypothetical protein
LFNLDSFGTGGVGNASRWANEFAMGWIAA